MGKLGGDSEYLMGRSDFTGDRVRRSDGADEFSHPDHGRTIYNQGARKVEEYVVRNGDKVSRRKRIYIGDPGTKRAHIFKTANPVRKGT